MGTKQDHMSDVEYQLAYEDAQYEIYLDSTPQQDHPRAIILAGQPGAGKTIYRDKAIEGFREQGGSVLIDPDNLREYHPRYEKYVEKDIHTAATKVQDDASKMAQQLRQEAIVEQRNVIIDGTLGSSQRSVALCQELKNNKYQIKIIAVAVDDVTSYRNVCHRLEQQAQTLRDPEIHQKAYPRDVPRDYQKYCYDGMPNSLKNIEEQNLADHIVVVDRYGEVIYENSNHIHIPNFDAKMAIETERNQEQTSLEKADHAHGWDTIIAWAKLREAGDEDLQTYKEERGKAYDALLNDSQARSDYFNQLRRDHHEGYVSWKAAPQKVEEERNREMERY